MVDADRTTLRADVLVMGGGMAGTVAAIAAARAGADTLLVERLGFLGGAATAAAVGQFVGWETRSGRRTVGGIAEEIVERLRAIGGSDGHTHFTMSTGHRMDRVCYDPELLKPVLDAMAGEAGVRLLFHAALLDVERDGPAIAAVQVLTKAGPWRVEAKAVIDASGDLDLLARAGAGFLELAEGQSMQPATAMFRFGPMDLEAFEAIPGPELAALARQGVEEGRLARAALHASRIEGTRDAWFNISRVAFDATDPLALSAAEVEGRRQALAAAAFLAERVPGCAGGRLVATAPVIGVRESRRVAGRHLLTEAELHAGTPFPDRIAWGAYPMDIHPPKGAGLHFEEFGADHAYAIPFGSLVPQGLGNVLVAGRGISATHKAHAAIRVMPIVMAIGQAAGLAAAQAVQGNAPVAEADVARLQARLRADGAILP
ncbi:FAD dependent oxidoreductase [Roseomonas rosea]|uniref:FAD dependent oxidoreductase n=1 Tax=Muricoccus roseus TaxID=198092 RepID=A0A1M6ATF7_9PROT|nr:FAD-dependent oxidoreductase [Roseomonas rosea]SHI39799.1 FAD dependent oxidoreductase [Roseomonas rosea]